MAFPAGVIALIVIAHRTAPHRRGLRSARTMRMV
jgi:hypothetical protein